MNNPYKNTMNPEAFYNWEKEHKKSYRPEGWKNPDPCSECNFSEKLSCNGVCNESIRYSSKEAGADAMLEGLMTRVRYRVVAEYVDRQEQTIDSKNGYLVFIEE